MPPDFSLNSDGEPNSTICNKIVKLRQLICDTSPIYLSRIHDYNFVVVCNRVDAVRHREDRALGKGLSDGLLNQVVGLDVHVGRGLVEYKDLVSSETPYVSICYCCCNQIKVT
jgi:hypothetical protein